MILPMLLACASTDPAPADIDGLFHYFWDKYRAGSDEELVEAITHAQAAVARLDLPATGSLTRLSSAQVADLPAANTGDPAKSAGLYLINPLPCTMEQLEALIIDADQQALHESYDTYQRSFLTSFDDYVARRSQLLDWDTDYSASLAFYGNYDNAVRSGARHVPDGGPGLLSGSWMREAAVFEDPDQIFDTDYQIEVWWPAPEGGVIHYYGIWRHMYLGPNLTTDDEFVVSITLAELENWDKPVAERCEADAG